jgi:predicted phosphodiesterase
MSKQEHRPRLNYEAYKYITNLKEENSVLVIGDIHEPFCLDGYLDFCKKMYDKHNCNEVVFIGDIVDNHYASYHEDDIDAMGGADELDLAIKKIAEWYKAFPKATIIIGNHDRIIMRKAQSSKVPKKWIRNYKDVLEVPNWNFKHRHVIDEVQYIHGEGGAAHLRAQRDCMSTVQGHLHKLSYTQWFVGATYRIFGMQVGCGIDHESYAMAYAKHHAMKPAIGVGIIKGGKLAINELMEL